MMDTATAARAVKGRVIGGNVRFDRVVTDTRALAPGDLFVALKGERFDGHAFVADALAKGAVAALVADDRASSLAGDLIAVRDPLAALGRLAAHWRGLFSIPVIVVVGSNGKTTVKEMLAAVLRVHFGADGVLATRGNLNNAIGLPLTLLGLSSKHRVAAIELGMNHPGETALLAAIAQPTVALVNNAQREHQEFMASVEDVAQEHAALIRALARDGTAVINGDDPHVGVWRAATPAGVRVIEFGLDRDVAVRGRYAACVEGGRLDLETPLGRATLRLPVPGRHNAMNALAASAAAISAGASLEAITGALAAFRPLAGRLVARRGRTGAAIIDDTYNANPDSVRAAIDVLAQMPGTRWLALGDMGEVGAQGPAFHREIGEYARAAGIDRLFTAGALASEAAAAYGPRAEHHAEVEALAARLAAIVSRGTTVLVKGSRFMRMERVVAALVDERSPEGAH